jgi:hypothetical protein
LGGDAVAGRCRLHTTLGDLPFEEAGNIRRYGDEVALECA